MDRKKKVFFIALVSVVVFISQVTGFDFNLDGSPVLNDSVTFKCGANVTCNQSGVNFTLDAKSDVDKAYVDTQVSGLNLTLNNYSVNSSIMTCGDSCHNAHYVNYTVFNEVINTKANVTYMITDIFLVGNKGVKIFNMTYPFVINSTHVYVNGLSKDLFSDYNETLNGSNLQNITYSSNLYYNDNIKVEYEKQN